MRIAKCEGLKAKSEKRRFASQNNPFNEHRPKFWPCFELVGPSVIPVACCRDCFLFAATFFFIFLYFAVTFLDPLFCLLPGSTVDVPTQQSNGPSTGWLVSAYIHTNPIYQARPTPIKVDRGFGGIGEFGMM